MAVLNTYPFELSNNPFKEAKFIKKEPNSLHSLFLCWGVAVHFYLFLCFTVTPASCLNMSQREALSMLSDAPCWSLIKISRLLATPYPSHLIDFNSTPHQPAGQLHYQFQRK